MKNSVVTVRILVAQKTRHRYCLVQAIPTQHTISYLKHTRSVDENLKKILSLVLNISSAEFIEMQCYNSVLKC